jgi:superfamily II DNA/RNA helicase
MEQSDRIAEFDRFKKDEITILVASDVAARGLDVKGVSHVINFDVPWQPDDYIHRIGRTGRAGMKGIAITLATRDDAEAIDRIEKLIGHEIPRVGAPAKQEEQRSAQEPERAAEPKTRQLHKARAKADQPESPPPVERSPVVEDIKGDWNGPLPSFLSVSAV